MLALVRFLEKGIHMLTKMRNILRMTWRQAYTSKFALLPTVSAAEQTKSSWAKPIKSYAAVPNVYKDFFEPFLADGRVFPYTVLTPSYEGFIHRTTEKLICDFGREIYVLERSGNTFEAQCYPLAQLILRTRPRVRNQRNSIIGSG